MVLNLHPGFSLFQWIFRNTRQLFTLILTKIGLPLREINVFCSFTILMVHKYLLGPRTWQVWAGCQGHDGVPLPTALSI